MNAVSFTRRVGIVVVTIAACAAPASAATIHVDWAGGGDYLTIQEGVNAATYGDTVLVSSGTYSEHVDIVAGADGITLASIAGREATTIDGGGLTGSSTVYCSHVGAGTRIEGFRITGTSPTSGGYAISVYESTLDISSSIFTECTGRAGIGVENSVVDITDCVISGNSNPGGSGGGIGADNSYLKITDSSIRDNSAEKGGAIHCWQCTGLELVGNTIASNTATEVAAAIVLYYPGPVCASGNAFVGNTVESWGAATMYVEGSVDQLVFTDNVFFGNTSPGEMGSLVFAFGAPDPVFNANFLCDDVMYQVAFGSTPLPYATFDFTGNWWGTTDPVEISRRIFDCEDNSWIRWYADFSGWCTEASCSGTVTTVPGESEQQVSWGRLKSMYR